MKQNGPLAIVLRPERFEDVVGQDHAVRYLSQLIVRGPFCRNILLHGSVGSGKTTLARLYAKSLNCELSVSRGGSPCKVDLQYNPCESCRRFDASMQLGAGRQCEFYELDAPSLIDGKLFENALPSVDLPKRHDKRRTIFIDEVHALKENKSAFLLLLKRLEEEDRETSYVFATTEIDEIPRAVRSRVALLQIRPLPLALATSFLAEVAEKEKIAVEPKALTLLAGIGEGQPRDLLQRLEQVATFGDVTVEQVRWVFDIDHTGALVGYFQALADGDHQNQIDRFQIWSLDIKEKIRLIQLFILSIFYQNILNRECLVDPLIASIGEMERRDILGRLRSRLDDDDRLQTVWRRMIEFWTALDPRQTEASLILRISQFHRLMNEAASAEDGPPLLAQRIDTTTRATKVSAIPRRLLNPVRLKPGVQPSQDHLGSEAVRTLINVASSAVQAYGLQFNARFTVWHDEFDNMKGKSITSEFHRRLSGQVWGSVQKKVARISIQERDQQRGMCTRVVAQVPDGAIEDIKSWSDKWLIDKRRPDAVEHRIRPERDRRYSTHRQNVLWLCGGLDPELQGWDHPSNTWRPLAKCLNIPTGDQRSIGTIERHKESTRSEPLYDKTLDGLMICVGPMPYLSAFDDGQWDSVAGSWELQEHDDRRRTADDRAREIERVMGLYPYRSDGRTEEARDIALADLRKSWSDDPKERPRTWKTWWDAPAP